MQVTTTFRQMPSSDALREYAEGKITKLEKYYQGLIEARIAFSAGKTSQKAEVTVKGNGFRVRGEESAEDAYAALDLVVDKLSRQLRRQHDRLKDHHGTASAKRTVEEGRPRRREASARREGLLRLTYAPKPLFLDDALAQLEGEDRYPLLFVNAETGAVNAVFRNADGRVGVIEPE